MPAIDVAAWRRWASKATGHEIADAIDALGQLRTELVRDAQRAGKAVPATGAATKGRSTNSGTSGSASGGSRAGKRPPDGRDALGRQQAGKATPPASVAEPDAHSRTPHASDGGAQRDAQGRRIYERASETSDSAYGNKRQRCRTRTRDAHGRTR